MGHELPSRRQLLTLTLQGLGASALAPLIAACEHSTRESYGHCIEPDDETTRTLAAFIDAVVPGLDSDPDGAPGALDACGLNVALDPAIPLADLAGLLVMVLDATAEESQGAPFAELDLAARTAVLEEVEQILPELTLAMRLARSSFYASLYGDLAERWLGVFGPNLGYLGEDFGFGESPLCEEMTVDGNLP